MLINAVSTKLVYLCVFRLTKKRWSHDWYGCCGSKPCRDDCSLVYIWHRTLHDYTSLLCCRISLPAMEITRFTFFLPQFVLAMLSYLAGYYTPPRLRFIYVALQAAMFFSVLYYVPSSTAGNDYQWATGMSLNPIWRRQTDLTILYSMFLSNDEIRRLLPVIITLWWFLSQRSTEIRRVIILGAYILGLQPLIFRPLLRHIISSSLPATWPIPQQFPDPIPQTNHQSPLSACILQLLLPRRSLPNDPRGRRDPSSRPSIPPAGILLLA